MNSSIKKIVIWGGWYGSRNVGDRLLLITISDLLDTTIDNFRLSILTANPDRVKEYYNNPLHEFDLIKPTTQIRKLLTSLIDCDLVIFGGGVPFFNSYKQALSVFLLGNFLRFFHKPYILWCVSSYRIDNRFLGHLFRSVIGNASKITCRDRFTKAEFYRLGVHKNAIIVKDPAFSLENFDDNSADFLFNKYVPEPIEDNLFALTPRTLRINDAEAQTHYTSKDQSNIDHQIKTYVVAINWLIENGFTPIFIPMNSEPPDDDRIVSKQILSLCKYPSKVLIIDEIILPRAAPVVYSRCRGSLVSRVHGSISSFLGVCPPIMYGFETKHIGIMEEMKLSDYVFDTQSNPEEIINLLKCLIERSGVITKKIQALKQAFCDDAKKPLIDVIEILGH